MSKKIGQAGLQLIMSFEGCRLTAYKPVATEKYYTIGYGHYGPDVTRGMKISMAQAEAYLVADCQKFANYVDNKAYVPISLNDNQRDALISFAYNCGAGNLKKLCTGRTAMQIANKLLSYNKAGGKVLNGLTRRRKAERELFIKPVTHTDGNKKQEVAPVQQTYYVLGRNYKLKANMNVRVTAAGALKKWDALSVSGKSQSINNNGYGVLKSGTVVTVKDVKVIAESVWLQVPSGWICGRSRDKVYVE